MTKIDFEHTGVSALIKDYLKQKEVLKPFYSLFPTQENYAQQAHKKLKEYQHREVLHSVLSQQMNSLELSEKQHENLSLLKDENTATVTTGHQLNLLTGPLYFIYKILHVVKICEDLNQKDAEINYVPIYWMATEDHDFDEINHFYNYRGRVEYNTEDGGFVGDISTKSTEKSLQQFIDSFGDSAFENNLKEIIQTAYFQQHDLATATRILVHELLGDYGILILDANDADLKQCMIPYFEKELFNNETQNFVQQTNEALSSYKNQAYAREINLFYLENNQRERIEKTKHGFTLVDSLKEFSLEEFKQELHSHPEKFSPNVILRPMYQEVILPNVAYIGGGGEIAYWLQLKSAFENYGILFPMLVVRNSMLLVPNAYKHKAEKYDLLSEKMFETASNFKNKFTEQQSDLFEELDDLKISLEKNFESLEHLAEKTTSSFGSMVEAQKKKQLKGYDNMHKRLLKAEKKRFKVEIKKIDEVYDYFFPRNNWQERVINFSEFYITNGQDLFSKIHKGLDAFDSSFNIVILDSIAKK